MSALRLRAAGIPNESHAQGAYQETPSAWTRNDVGTPENGGADHNRSVPGCSTTTCVSASV